MLENQCDEIVINIVDGDSIDHFNVNISYTDGDDYDESAESTLRFGITAKPIDYATIAFYGASGNSEVAILSVSYLKNGAVVGSSLVQNGSCELKLLKYKVELPRGAKVTLFDDESIEAQFLSWNIPCPRSFPNMTFLQVKAANGFEQQITPSAGSQTIELYQELGRRYAVFGEIWTYSFAQTLWFASLRIQKSDYEWQDCVPTAGEGGTIVTALPQ